MVEIIVSWSSDKDDRKIDEYHDESNYSNSSSDSNGDSSGESTSLDERYSSGTTGIPLKVF